MIKNEAIKRDPYNAEAYFGLANIFRDRLFEEVGRLLEAGFSGEAPGLKTIGYREIIAHLAGGITAAEAVSLVKRDTRRYAKRQVTWFKRMALRRWISMGEPGDAADQITADWRRL